jgi:hypothetical protein
VEGFGAVGLVAVVVPTEGPTGWRRDTGAMDEKLPSKDTRHTLRLASQEAEAAMLRLVGVCRPELFPADQWDTLRRINRELEDASETLYAMAVRGTKEASERD